MPTNVVTFDIDFYNDHHKSILEKHKYGSRISKLVSHGLTVKEKEFLIYAMFTEQADCPGFANHSELKKKVSTRKYEIHDYLDTANGTVRSVVATGQKYITERAGVAAALLVMNDIFNLHQADWERIPEIPTQKTMDFQIACNGSDFVLVEAKGRIVTKGQLPHDGQLETNITDKKKDHLESDPTLKSLFGVITGIPHQQPINAKCLLLDPALEAIYEDPEKYQLLARMYFYTRLLTVISPGQVVRDLRNRIQVLRRAKDHTEFDRLTLVDLYGKPIVPPPDEESLIPIWNKTVNKDRMIGHVFPISESEFAYFAIDMEIFRLMIDQDFDAIRRYESLIDREFIDDVSLDAKVDTWDLEKYRIPYDKYDRIPETSKVSIPVSGNVHYSRSGLILGFFHMAQ